MFKSTKVIAINSQSNWAVLIAKQTFSIKYKHENNSVNAEVKDLCYNVSDKSVPVAVMQTGVVQKRYCYHLNCTRVKCVPVC